MKLYAEKAETDSSMPNGFLSKLAKFLKSSGREIPFDESLLAKVNKVIIHIMPLLFDCRLTFASSENMRGHLMIVSFSKSKPSQNSIQLVFGVVS